MVFYLIITLGINVLNMCRYFHYVYYFPKLTLTVLVIEDAAVFCGGVGEEDRDGNQLKFQKLLCVSFRFGNCGWSYLKDESLCEIIFPFIQPPLCLKPLSHTCKKPIRNLVTRINGQEIGVIQEKFTWGNQVSQFPSPDYGNKVPHLHLRNQLPGESRL